MKKILIPTDFSTNAEHALKVAAQIAKNNNGEIILLHPENDLMVLLI
jgi:nucleotide-binding universal stress UspA family protein